MQLSAALCLAAVFCPPQWGAGHALRPLAAGLAGTLLLRYEEGASDGRQPGAAPAPTGPVKDAMEAPDDTPEAAGGPDAEPDPEPKADAAPDPRPAADAGRTPRTAPARRFTPADDPMAEPDDEVVAIKAAATAKGTASANPAAGAPRGVVQANPAPVIARQPDGSEVALRLRGGEQSNWQEDLNGFPVLRTGEGWYVYAKPNEQGKLTPTTLRVGKADPKSAGIKAGFKPKRPTTAEEHPKKTANGHGSASEAAPPADPMADEEADDAAAGS